MLLYLIHLDQCNYVSCREWSSTVCHMVIRVNKGFDLLELKEDFVFVCDLYSLVSCYWHLCDSGSSIYILQPGQQQGLSRSPIGT